MATITATAGGYQASIEVPTDEQVMDWLRSALVLEIVGEAFQNLARTEQLAAIAALQAKVDDLRDAGLPALEITET